MDRKSLKILDCSENLVLIAQEKEISSNNKLQLRIDLERWMVIQALN